MFRAILVSQSMMASLQSLSKYELTISSEISNVNMPDKFLQNKREHEGSIREKFNHGMLRSRAQCLLTVSEGVYPPNLSIVYISGVWSAVVNIKRKTEK